MGEELVMNSSGMSDFNICRAWRCPQELAGLGVPPRAFLKVQKQRQIRKWESVPRAGDQARP